MNRFPFFFSYYDAYATLSSESDKVKFIDALMKYAFFGEEPDLPENLATMFILVKPNIEKSVKNVLQGARNGKKGGAPNGNQNARKKSAGNETTPGLNENKADKDKEKEKDMEYGEQNKQLSVSTDGQTAKPDLDFDSLASRS